MKIKCAVKGCISVFETNEAVSPNFRYICSGRVAYGDDRLAHTREQQCVTAGRVYNPATDEADKDIHFQNYQFDKDLDRIGGTNVETEGDDISDIGDTDR